MAQSTPESAREAVRKPRSVPEAGGGGFAVGGTARAGERADGTNPIHAVLAGVPAMAEWLLKTEDGSQEDARF